MQQCITGNYGLNKLTKVGIITLNSENECLAEHLKMPFMAGNVCHFLDWDRANVGSDQNVRRPSTELSTQHRATGNVTGFPLFLVIAVVVVVVMVVDVVVVVVDVDVVIKKDTAAAK